MNFKLSRKKNRRVSQVPARKDGNSLFKRGKDFDWKVVLVISFTFLAFTLAISATKFFITRGFIEGTKEIKTKETKVDLDTKRIVEVQNVFRDRDDAFKRFNKNVPFVLEVTTVDTLSPIEDASSTDPLTSTSTATSTPSTAPTSTSGASSTANSSQAGTASSTNNSTSAANDPLSDVGVE